MSGQTGQLDREACAGQRVGQATHRLRRAGEAVQHERALGAAGGGEGLAAATAARTLIALRAPSSRISIGRFTPAITSIFSLFIRLMARFDGVPPNRSDVPA